ncbi:MAG: sugar phosphate nucleotidyltransferase [Methanocorpusculum sp.]|nr:sugar phosphate nucleotidyltransferase [Methanocorpusculum sp.]
MSDIQAVILAAGEGTRLRPLTKNRPKVMLPVVNRPILEHVLDAVVKAGIRDITVVVGYKKEQVMTFLNKYPMEISVAVQDKQLGTAHALSCAKEFIHTKTVILPGDNYIDSESIKKMMEADDAILVSHHPHPENFGVVVQKGGFLEDIIEKPDTADESSLVSCGVYTLSPKLIGKISVCNMTDLMKALVSGKDKISVIEADDWEDAVYPKDLLSLNRHLLSAVKTSKAGIVDKSAKITGSVVIGENTKIGANCVIEGPVVIGDDCNIDGDVHIGGGTSIGSHTTIEPFTYIKNSILMNSSSVGSHSRIVDTVIGEGCICMDHISTVTEEVGAVLGDRVTVGPFTILNGCSIGNNTTIKGRKTIDFEIPEGSLVI